MSKKKEPVDSGFWKIDLFQPDLKGNLSYDSGHIEFTHNIFPYVIRKPNTWLKGEGAYATEEYKIPSVIDVWKMLCKEYECQFLSFNDWTIQRDYKCFIYLLYKEAEGKPELIHKNIMGDDLANQIHFIDMLNSLKEREDDLIDDKSIKLIDYKRDKKDQVKRMIDRLDDVLRSINE